MPFSIFTLALSLLSSPAGSAAEFNSALAEKLYASAEKPSLPELQSSNWLQIGGAAAYDPGKSAWAAGPVGYSDTGIFPVREINGQNRQQNRIVLEFREPRGGAGNVLLLKSYEPKQSFTSSESYLAYAEGAESVDFTVRNEGLAALGPGVSPAVRENYSADFSCRIKRPNHLLCVATLTAKEPGAIPALAPLVGKVFYRALYRRENAGAVAGRMPSPQGSAGSAAGATGQGGLSGASTTGGARAFRCRMTWRAGAKPITEIVTFTLLSKPARLGTGHMVGIGGSWDEADPKTVDKVIVVKTVETAGGTLQASLLKPQTIYGFSADWEIRDQLMNKAGLPMIGTISIPRGGGSSSVQYPPGWGQDAKQYQATLKDAPSNARCEERTAAEPADPYVVDAGIVR